MLYLSTFPFTEYLVQLVCERQLSNQRKACTRLTMGNAHSGGKQQGSGSSSPSKAKGNAGAGEPTQANGGSAVAGAAPGVRGMTRTASGADIQDRSQAQFQPVDKLGRILAKKCEELHGIHGVTGDVFAVSGARELCALFEFTATHQKPVFPFFNTALRVSQVP